MSDLTALDRAMRENHLTKPRPAPIPFPVCAGVHAPDCAPDAPEAEPLAPVLAEKHSTPIGVLKSEAREQQQLRAGLCHHEERAS